MLTKIRKLVRRYKTINALASEAKPVTFYSPQNDNKS